jgi:hypothetical protein
MKINEIKTKLGVDISIPNRKVVNVVLKALYVEQQFKDLKHLKQPEILKIISTDINCSRANIYNYFKKLKGYKLNTASKLIVKAYIEKDKKYIQQYYDFIKENYENTRDNCAIRKIITEIETAPKTNIIKIQKAKPIKLKSNLQVADYLKANKIFKYSKFWDRMILDYTDEDWFNLREINPKMFDSYKK